ncbi:GHMP family kinase ATP-binding protein [Bacteroides ilei]|uniref:GHMP family kinase ATP-binding protein n=1 Tax=Bacteroides ilei TaxID=1907658 RepID=UPI0009315F79|nr:kinase [Bacteroides ilei]
MIISKTPFRMSFFGGGTDIPDFFNEHGGSVISATFDKYCYVNVRHLPPFMPYRSEVVHSKIERINNIEEIEHPLIRESMRYLDIHEIRLTYEGDLPARTGLGTSSTFAVGMLNTFHALKGRYVSKKRLAEEAICIERDILKEHGGWQDQIAAAYGGLNRIDFKENKFTVHPVIVHPERKNVLNDNLLLFYTGIQRFSSEIQANSFSNPGNKINQLKEMLKLVDDAENILTDNKRDLNDFGRLLDTTWKLKRGIGSKITTSSIDMIYQRALKAGALGGKLLGAGGGGFLLFYVEKEKQNNVINELNELMMVPFRFEDEGTNIIHYSPIVYIPRK